MYFTAFIHLFIYFLLMTQCLGINEEILQCTRAPPYALLRALLFQLKLSLKAPVRFREAIHIYMYITHG